MIIQRHMYMYVTIFSPFLLPLNLSLPPSLPLSLQIMGGGASLSEAVAWFGVQHPVREAVEIFTQEIAPAGTGMGKPVTAPIQMILSLTLSS